MVRELIKDYKNNDGLRKGKEILELIKKILFFKINKKYLYLLHYYPFDEIYQIACNEFNNAFLRGFFEISDEKTLYLRFLRTIQHAIWKVQNDVRKNKRVLQNSKELVKETVDPLANYDIKMIFEKMKKVLPKQQKFIISFGLKNNGNLRGIVCRKSNFFFRKSENFEAAKADLQEKLYDFFGDEIIKYGASPEFVKKCRDKKELTIKNLEVCKKEPTTI